MSDYPLPSESGVSVVIANIVPILALVHKNGEVKSGEVKDKKNGATTFAALPLAATFAAALASIFVL